MKEIKDLKQDEIYRLLDNLSNPIVKEQEDLKQKLKDELRRRRELPKIPTDLEIEFLDKCYKINSTKLPNGFGEILVKVRGITENPLLPRNPEFWFNWIVVKWKEVGKHGNIDQIIFGKGNWIEHNGKIFKFCLNLDGRLALEDEKKNREYALENYPTGKWDLIFENYHEISKLIYDN